MTSSSLVRKLCTELKLSRASAFELVAHFCHLTKAQVLADKEVAEEDFNQLMLAARQHHNGKPLAYLLGEWDFCGKKILCREKVLIPREDTEVLVNCALAEKPDAKSVWDLCCGSGCVGIALAEQLQAKVTSCDISEEALSLTKENAELWNVSHLMDIKRFNLLSDTEEKHFDLIVSNPPYIASEQVKKLDKSVRDYEPHLALDGGEDGLLFYPHLARLAQNNLNENGVMAVEIGFDQGEKVKTIFQSFGFEPQLVQDLQGLDRVVWFKK